LASASPVSLCSSADLAQVSVRSGVPSFLLCGSREEIMPGLLKIAGLVLYLYRVLCLKQQ